MQEVSKSHIPARFTLVGVIGEGTFGTVDRVWDRHLLCTRAIKSFKPEDNGDMSECALREIAFQSFLTDAGAPGVVPLLEVLTGAGPEVGILMPLMQRDLADEIEDKVFKSWSTIDPVLKDVLGALSFLHSLSPPLMHRDIKPENILRDAVGQTYLTDLGFMRFCKDEPPYATGAYSHGSNQRATKTYTAPEMLKHGVPHGPKVDVWATVVVAVELMRNSRLNARTDKTARKQLRQICEHMKDPMLKALSEGMLSEDPSNRWTAARLLEYAFTCRSVTIATPVENCAKLVVAEPVFEAGMQKHIGEILTRLDYKCPQTFYSACAFAAEALRWRDPTAAPSIFWTCVYACIAAGKLYEHAYWSLEELEKEFEHPMLDHMVRFQNLLIYKQNGRLLYPFPECITRALQAVRKIPKKRRGRRRIVSAISPGSKNSESTKAGDQDAGSADKGMIAASEPGDEHSSNSDQSVATVQRDDASLDPVLV